MRTKGLTTKRSYPRGACGGIMMLELTAVRMEFPADSNIIVGQSHFIKTVEDLYEAIVSTAPHAKFGLAFNEASGACRIRSDGNDEALRQTAIKRSEEHTSEL